MKTRQCTVIVVSALAALLAGCGGSSGGGGITPPPPPPPPPAAQSPAGVWVGQAVTPDVPDVVTSFEFNDADGFVIGNSPFSATFMGGVTETRAVGALYQDGLFSWHIPGNDAGVIDATVTFETPASTLSFWTRNVTAGDVAAIDVRDTAGAIIQTIVPPDAPITEFIINTMGGLPIGSVDITVTTGEIVIDLLTYGFPSTASTDDIGCVIASNDEFACVITDTVTDNLIAGANGTVSVNGNQVTGSGWVYAAPGEMFADGSTIATLNISAGTVSENTSLNLTVDGTGVSIAVTTLFDAVFDRGSDLATVAASYATFDIFGDASTFDVDATGAISGMSAAGCMLMGQLSIIDAADNAYDVAITVTDGAACGIAAGDYNGLGATEDEAVMDDAFIFGAFIDGVAMFVGRAVQ